jgi:hypothetical protein
MDEKASLATNVDGAQMNVVYSDRARQAGERFALLQDATEQLEETIRSYPGPVKAEWDRNLGLVGQSGSEVRAG